MSAEWKKRVKGIEKRDVKWEEPLVPEVIFTTLNSHFKVFLMIIPMSLNIETTKRKSKEGIQRSVKGTMQL